jgi:hypothetical protein
VAIAAARFVTTVNVSRRGLAIVQVTRGETAFVFEPAATRSSTGWRTRPSI